MGAKKNKKVEIKKVNTKYRNKYYDLSHPSSYGGKSSFLRSLKPKERADAESWLETQDTYLMHKTVPKKFARVRTVAGLETQLQGDLIDVSSLAKDNSNVKFLLTVIDVFSRKAFVEPLLRKTASSVALGFEKILNRLGFRPFYFNSDQGPEFVNATFKALLRKHKIDFFTSNDADIKCAVVERFNRTLMSKIYRYLTKHNSHRYLDVLPDIINNYNNLYHSAVGLAPSQVTHTNKEKVWQKLYNSPTKKSDKNNKKKKRLFSGDYVRIPKARKAFAKGFRTGWTGEIFKIRRVRPSAPSTFDLEDLSGENIKGVFYKQELLKCSLPDYFEVESVLDKKGDLLLVKWRHYPKKFNQWVSSKNIRGN